MSALLTLLEQKLVKEKGYPYFKVQSHNIQFLNSPVDFYLALCKGIKIAHRRIIMTSLYMGEGALETFLFDELFRKLDTNNSIRMSFLVDYNRGHRGNQFNSVNFFEQLKDNFQPTHRVRVGFFHQNRPFYIPVPSLQEIRGVQHMKMAVFDDIVMLTGANTSDSYFTDREDRWIVVKNCREFADFCDDLANSMIDCSHQMDDYGKLPRTTPKLMDERWKWVVERIKFFKYMLDEMPEIKVSSEPKKEVFNKEPANKEEEKSLSLYQESENQSKVLKRILKMTDVFNTLKNMPEEFNIVTGTGGWKNEVLKTGGDVYLFPCLNLGYFKCFDDYEFIKDVLPYLNNVWIASAYMNFPEEILNSLKGIEKLNLLSASPYANGFMGDGAKTWIPYFYRAHRDYTMKKLPQANFFEYFREGWTFHSKGIWAEGSGEVFGNIGGSNFSHRSFFRDNEFQVYFWSQCPDFRNELIKERDRIWRFGFNDKEKFPLKYRFPTRVLARLLRSYL